MVMKYHVEIHFDVFYHDIGCTNTDIRQNVIFSVPFKDRQQWIRHVLQRLHISRYGCFVIIVLESLYILIVLMVLLRL